FLARPLLLKLACSRPDGWPYVIPLWFAWLNQKLYVVARERAVWIDYIRDEPRVGVLIDEEDRRHARVQMTATASVIEGPLPRRLQRSGGAGRGAGPRVRGRAGGPGQPPAARGAAPFAERDPPGQGPQGGRRRPPPLREH